jgi:hypothetical protein
MSESLAPGFPVPVGENVMDLLQAVPRRCKLAARPLAVTESIAPTSQRLTSDGVSGSTRYPYSRTDLSARVDSSSVVT